MNLIQPTNWRNSVVKLDLSRVKFANKRISAIRNVFTNVTNLKTDSLQSHLILLKYPEKLPNVAHAS